MADTDSNVFTVDLHRNFDNVWQEVKPWTGSARGSTPAYDIGILDLTRRSSTSLASQVNQVLTSIADAQGNASEGGLPVVVMFVHGWHHGPDWFRTPGARPDAPDGDEHFAGFRDVLRMLVLREEERPRTVDEPLRRVLGIYVGWDGDPDHSVWKLPIIRQTTFWNRYRTARKLAQSDEVTEAIACIVDAVRLGTATTREKIRRSTTSSPLIVIGHSMGALIVQSILLTLLARPGGLSRQREPSRNVSVRDSLGDMCFPDLVLSLNSAADSRTTKAIVRALANSGVRKEANGEKVSFAPPIIASATSKSDLATKIGWRFLQGIHWSRRTDGHDRTLLTHSLRRTAASPGCLPHGQLDHGQNWHCLRPPEPAHSPSPDFGIDLPERERLGVADIDVPHSRYTLACLDHDRGPHLSWIFPVPRTVMHGHNDIFNSRATSLILAIIQISGAVISLAKRWDSYEE